MLVVNKILSNNTQFLLYDLKEDPYQQQNIALESKQLIRKLMDNELIPKLKYIEDEWWRIPVTDAWEYPEYFRQSIPYLQWL